MTLIYEKLTGYGRACKMIVYVSAFHEVFKGTGSMKFYDGDFSGVVDASLDANGTLTVSKYPHNNDKYIEEFSTRNQAAIARFLETLISRHIANTQINKRIFTLKFSGDRDIFEIKKTDFCLYRPNREIRPEMFIFDVPFANGGFPNIFVMDKSCRTGPFSPALAVFAEASHDVYDTVTSQTTEGKALVWAIYNSWNHGGFENSVPDITGNFHIPTNGRDKIPTFLNHSDLMFWGEKVGADMPVKGTVKNDDPFKAAEKEDKPAQKAEERKPVTNPFGELDGTNLKAWVEQGIKSSGSVNLSDLYVFSLEETLKLIEKPDTIIHVNLDSTIGVKKMCIYQGMIHYIPSSVDFDPITYFGDDVDLFQVETEETYPRYLLPSLTKK
jgi:hypothetical protein